MANPERVALLHYHLRGGGVTRVLEHQQRALDERGIRSVILVGEAPQGPLPHHDILVLPDLAYGTDAPNAAGLARNCREAATNALGGAPDLWHIHNHSLGKNLAAVLLVRQLADEAEALVLQMHDFAEDGRPANYALLAEHFRGSARGFGEMLYPQGGRIHYAPINGRDADFLRAADFADDHVHGLANAIHFDTDTLEAAPKPDLGGRRLHLYPTRAIRRKNVGEFLLWSALSDGDEIFGLTLGPKNPAERPEYEAWCRFAADAGLPAQFAMTEESDFLGLMKAADSLVTTSVAEGFGLAFLEPLLIGKPLSGRALPEITTEFRNAGIDMNSLYERVDVPLVWVGSSFRQQLAERLGAAFKQYGRTATEADVQRAFEAAVCDDCVDFGRLNALQQRGVIEHLLADPGKREAIRPTSLDCATVPPEAVATGRTIVEQDYSLDRYGERLLAIYREALDGEPRSHEPADATGLLERFLDPARFFLLRS